MVRIPQHPQGFQEFLRPLFISFATHTRTFVVIFTFLTSRIWDLRGQLMQASTQVANYISLLTSERTKEFGTFHSEVD